MNKIIMTILGVVLAIIAVGIIIYKITSTLK